MIYDQASAVVIHLRGDALRAARKAIRKQFGWRAAWRFVGPHFKATPDCDIHVAIGASTVNVGCTTDTGSTEYIYPLHSVGRIKTVALNEDK